MINLVGLFFDGALAILLMVTIGYCARLSKRIRLLQDNRSELATMIAQFDQATGRAVNSFAELQSVSKRITEALQLKIDKANFLADDLAFLIEKSTKLTTQLEQLNLKRTAEVNSVPKPQPTQQPQSYFKPSAPTAAPFRPKLASPRPASNSGSDIPPSVMQAASLEALLNRLASGTGVVSPSTPAKMPAAASSQPMQGPRTDAERELLEALKASR